MPVIQIDNVSKAYRLGAIGGGTLREDVARWWARFRGRPDPFLKIGQEQRSEVRGQKSEVGGQRSEVRSQRSEVRGQKSEARGTITDHRPPTSDLRPPTTDHRPPTSDLRSPTSDLRPPTSGSDLFWALRNVSLEVKEGEILGIIGRNGAGKSTLLKILSRVTAPTEGEIRVRGRIASLLEVGTGFHPELTGRENVFLNGAILGMTKPEIRRKFDEIVDFSGVEQFIDTPVKRYSSGMYVRLAFAVAAHLEPEILVVDEVLAVGDAQFQKRCLGKMKDVAQGGRTVLFVSHNMSAITALCPNSLLLVDGKAVDLGNSVDIVAKYLENAATAEGEIRWPDLTRAPGNERVRLHAVRIVSEGKVASNVDIAKEVTIEMEYWNFDEGAAVSASIHLLDRSGVGVLASGNLPSVTSIPDPWVGRPFPVGLFRTRCTIPANFLNEGQYKINAILLTDVTNVQARADEAVSFHAYDSGEMRREYVGNWLGVVRPKLPWETQQIGELDAHSFQDSPRRLCT